MPLSFAYFETAAVFSFFFVLVLHELSCWCCCSLICFVIFLLFLFMYLFLLLFLLLFGFCELISLIEPIHVLVAATAHMFLLLLLKFEFKLDFWVYLCSLEIFLEQKKRDWKKKEKKKRKPCTKISNLFSFWSCNMSWCYSVFFLFEKFVLLYISLCLCVVWKKSKTKKEKKKRENGKSGVSRARTPDLDHPQPFINLTTQHKHHTPLGLFLLYVCTLILLYIF